MKPSQELIMAPATAPGQGAIAVIRLSGEGAIAATDSIFGDKQCNGKDLTSKKGQTLHFGVIHENGKIIDEVLLSIFKAPHSYTAEDVVEISCHGSSYIQQQILSILMHKGARMARPGEFTMRAFMNGKLDLSQAEAVADLIASTSEASHHIAMQQMRGGFSSHIHQLRHKLIQFAALIELELDFSEEDVEFADRSALKQLVMEIMTEAKKLSASFEAGNAIRNGIPVTIAGKPNAGKSTLLNVLLEEERAIVSPIPGTTRDTIEDVITLGGFSFRFIDTAGLRDTADEIEAEGVIRTRSKIKQSSIVIYLFDIQNTSVKDLREELDFIQKDLEAKTWLLPVANKSDLNAGGNFLEGFEDIKDILCISAKQKTHTEQLKDALIKAAASGMFHGDDVIVSNARHAEALTQTYLSLDTVYKGLENGLSGDLLSVHIRAALHHLGEITGEITTDDLLDKIFRDFCIGK